ncbi:MAG: filamentous hemagglutinin N-terminal domain-containing protein, partial [Sinobacteraceae bacterium]|nr:filamentous hemagglutinin N-terminal domain-containing protein [Nevskiaceae bacterium]
MAALGFGMSSIAALAGGAAPLAPLPSGAQVVVGAGSVTTQGSATVIRQSSSKMVVNWQSFNVGTGKSVEFVQPSASAVALNRVVGSDASVIQGQLKANGHIFLVNPNGVVFSSTARVDAGGLVASTLQIKDEDFLAGRYVFVGQSAQAVTNAGTIRASEGGGIALIAARIVNEGELTAHGGRIALGAGDRVTLDLGGATLLQVENSTLETLIDNGGVIRAGAGRVLITSKAADSLRASVINNGGVIEAQSLGVGSNGAVVLYATGGTLNNFGSIKARGGFVETSGKQYNNLPGATVEAGEWLIDPVNINVDAA